MKRRIVILLATMLPLVASAYDAEIDGIYYNFNGDEAEVTFMDDDFSSYSGDVSVPASVEYKGKTYHVTAIGDYAFAYCDELASCSLPEGIKSLGKMSFDNCDIMTSIKLPESLTSIGVAAFLGSGLTAVYIPKGVTFIDIEAFVYCNDMATITVDGENKVYDSRNDCNAIIETATNRLIAGCKNTVIPDDVTCIAEYSFGSEGMTSIFIPKGVTVIEEDAITGSPDLESIVVDAENKAYESPDNCNAIIETATKMLVLGCKNTVIPNGTKAIGEYAFDYCLGLTSVTFPETVTSIGQGAFYACENLTDVNLSKGLKEIGLVAFSGCSKIVSINFPEGLTTIGSSAFSRCFGLTGTIVIPKNVTSIGELVFSQCTKINSLKVEEDNTVYDSRNDCNAIIETASNRLVAGCSSTVIPEDVTSIAAFSFFECPKLTSVTIPKGVTLIEEGTFYFCDGLTSFTIPEGVTDIEYRGIYSCWGLKSVSIASTVTFIDEEVFADCKYLRDVYCFAEQVPETDESVFYKTPIEEATLYVPESAIDAYRATAPWSGFGTIVALEATPVESISKKAEDGITTYYDLQGRKVMSPTKGLYLMNGKKVLVK